MISYNGFDTKYITMEGLYDDPKRLKIGDFVKVTDEGTVDLADPNKPFFGMVVGNNDNYYTVQVSGYAEIDFAGAGLPMYARLIVNKRGTLQNSTSTTYDAPLRKVIWVDKNENRAGVIL
ncbi:hypothetical protein [uncultured Eubacterium sp.]|mgnify:CR=1 FL=1|uniref:hypothetical protein n=1 Tax=uncultured Eubacterium sp. TaxID=165185 RepID=UPI0026212009|nr:hypothetical protein [uncultured Eubacterium sp.]